MNRFRWVILVVLICLPVAFLALDWRLPGFREIPSVARPLPVPSGDQEMAWLHTTTNNTTWERFVSGWVRVQKFMPDVDVDTSKAFLDSTTAVPEIVIGMRGREARLHIRWYKLQNDITAADWVKALAAREQAPLAVIGGGSSDRAVDLARAMEAQREWKGDRPPLFITTATADSVADLDSQGGVQPRLVDIYDDRSFRFCFTNRQMADAVLDFVDRTDDLRPIVFELESLQAITSTLAAHPKPWRYRPHVFSVQWNDDPYSTDLHDQFQKSLLAQVQARDGNQTAFQLSRFDIPFSVGGFVRPNRHEDETATAIAGELRNIPAQRSLLVLPAVTLPARRFLRAIIERAPQLSKRLVVVTGDGIPGNAILRDSEFAWRAGGLPVPLVLFTHNNPIGWDDPTLRTSGPTGYSFLPPNSTEEAMHFAEMGRVIATACFPRAGETGTPTLEGGLVTRGNDLVARLHAQRPAFFDADGERLGGTGEHVEVLMPRDDADPVGGAAQLSVWRRESDKSWRSIGRLPVIPRDWVPGSNAP